MRRNKMEAIDDDDDGGDDVRAPSSRTANSKHNVISIILILIGITHAYDGATASASTTTTYVQTSNTHTSLKASSEIVYENLALERVPDELLCTAAVNNQRLAQASSYERSQQIHFV